LDGAVPIAISRLSNRSEPQAQSVASRAETTKTGRINVLLGVRRKLIVNYPEIGIFSRHVARIVIPIRSAENSGVRIGP
jgi:hypothetical protein